MTNNINTRQRIEVADVIAQCYPELQGQVNLCPVQQKAIDDILSCRTAMKGGHISYCNNCGYYEQSYNSCRNRHCPKCQYLKQQVWVDKLKGRLIPCRYFHIVFTIPHELNRLFYLNQQLCYDLLFESSKQALLNAGSNCRFLGADVGAVCVLHTWGQTLVYHPHVHMLVPAGGLSEDGMEWVSSTKKFFVPVKALSSMFRAILIKGMTNLINSDKLKIPDGQIEFSALKRLLFQKPWNVYSKKAFRGINSVLEYLGRYTHRVAISNSRLVCLDSQNVSFRYKNYRARNKIQIITLTNLEFAKRFIKHILPRCFYKIRYVGILSTVHIHSKRETSISLLGQTMWLSMLEGLNAYEVLRIISGKDPALCPVCKCGVMKKYRLIPKLE